MIRRVLVTMSGLAGVLLAMTGLVSAQPAARMVGTWTLNREASHIPKEVGFGADLIPEAPDARGRGGMTGGEMGRGRGGRGGGGADRRGPAGQGLRRESREDADRMRLMTAEARDAALHLTIADSGTAITVSDDQGRARSFRPGRDEVFQLTPEVSLGAKSAFEGNRFVVTYDIEEGRQLRYTYSATAEPRRLAVDIEFLEHGGHDVVHRVYEPTRADEPRPAPASASTVSAAPPGAGGPPPLLRRPPEPGGMPPAGPAASPDVPSAPVAGSQRALSLRGLTKVSIAVDGVGSEAATCGLTQAAVEAEVRKSLTDAGVTVSRVMDEDTYVLVRITTSLPAQGLCVSRYDVSLDTHTMAAFTHQRTPALVEVSLLREGGLVGGAPAAHAAGLLQGVRERAGQFGRAIRDANR